MKDKGKGETAWILYTKIYKKYRFLKRGKEKKKNEMYRRKEEHIVKK